MTYEVIVLPRAERQLLNAALWWSENRSLEQAVHWLDGFETALATLSSNPQSHDAIPEHRTHAFTFTFRQIVYGVGKTPTHRAIFEVRGKTVYVHAIRHLAQDDVVPGEI